MSVQVYCVECAERCASCERPLNGNHMELKGKKYHHECFKCMRCSKPMGPEVYMLDNCPACLKCCEEVFEMRQTEAQGTS